MVPGESRSGGAEGVRWDRLGALLREEAPGEFDVARLRRRVRAAAGLHDGRRPVARAAAVAAALALVALGGAWLAGTARGNGTEVRLVAARDGRVIIEFADGREHRVIRSTSPVPGPDAVARTARGRTVVDDGGHPAPGTAVFYRID